MNGVRRLLVTAWLGLVLACAPTDDQQAPAQPQDLAIGGGACVPTLPTAIADPALAAAFQRYAAFLRRCPIPPGATPALHVIAVQVNDYYTSLPGTPVAEDIPLPLLQAADGRQLGRLPVHFPEDGPVEATLRLRQWRDGWPWEIRIDFATVAIGRPPAITMAWQAAAKRYAPIQGGRP